MQDFKKRNGIQSIKVKGETAFADVTAADEFLFDFTNVVATGQYTSDNIYNGDGTGVFWTKSIRIQRWLCRVSDRNTDRSYLKTE